MSSEYLPGFVGEFGAEGIPMMASLPSTSPSGDCGTAQPTHPSPEYTIRADKRILFPTRKGSTHENLTRPLSSTIVSQSYTSSVGVIVGTRVGTSVGAAVSLQTPKSIRYESRSRYKPSALLKPYAQTMVFSPVMFTGFDIAPFMT